MPYPHYPSATRDNVLHIESNTQHDKTDSKDKEQQQKLDHPKRYGVGTTNFNNLHDKSTLQTN